jgi:hypothetical protein
MVDAVVLAAGLVAVLGVMSAPIVAAQRGHAGPSAPIVVGEREGERLERQAVEVDRADSPARPAIETGSGGAQGGQAPTGGLPT